ncbi:MAG: hypothetical protein ACP5RI_02905 [Candidatus Micrarchaeia archaeon]
MEENNNVNKNETKENEKKDIPENISEEQYKKAEEAFDNVDWKEVIKLGKMIAKEHVFGEGTRKGFSDLLITEKIIRKMKSLSNKATKKEKEGNYKGAIELGKEKIRLIDDLLAKTPSPLAMTMLKAEKEYTLKKIEEMNNKIKEQEGGN